MLMVVNLWLHHRKILPSVTLQALQHRCMDSRVHKLNRCVTNMCRRFYDPGNVVDVRYYGRIVYQGSDVSPQEEIYENESGDHGGHVEPSVTDVVSF
ncbi:hypothetical protein AVEN_26770-1 [Araneus ventricosus]|uniref:Uncharacterized protein n=1 Tax=Araneus ventricosus TaxID=182803 RepID=A0A4Y2D551_ARAVE|nr:hypothetical protein AVEN_26770-1 [Araneus ventricosus]